MGLYLPEIGHLQSTLVTVYHIRMPLHNYLTLKTSTDFFPFKHINGKGKATVLTHGNE